MMYNPNFYWFYHVRIAHHMACHEVNSKALLRAFENSLKFRQISTANDKRKALINTRFYWYLSNKLIWGHS